MKKGDSIYYYKGNDDPVPATILEVNEKTFKIRGNFIDGIREAVVCKTNCDLKH